MKRLVLALILILSLDCYPAYAKEWKEYKRSHFIIYYKESPIDFVQSVEEAAEDYYTEITRNLGFTRYKGWTWDERAKIYIFDDKDDFKDNGGHVGWASGVASPRNKVIRTFPSAHGFFDSTLPHELGHIIFREFVGMKADVPSWFEEGVAMYQEKAKRWGANKQVKEALANGAFIPISKLNLMRLNSQSERKKVDLFYAESASIVYYMIKELGEQRFERFCRKLKDGKPFEWALESAYFRIKTIDKLNDEWVEYLR